MKSKDILLLFGTPSVSHSNSLEYLITSCINDNEKCVYYVFYLDSSGNVNIHLQIMNIDVEYIDKKTK